MSETRRLEKLLRGELAAVESYERAVRDLGGADGTTADTFRGMLQDHREAVSTIRRHMDGAGADPDQDPGAWGAFANAVQKAGAALGDDGLLEAMRQGEVHGVSEYRTTLDTDDVPPKLKAEIRESLLPAQERHVQMLDRMLRG